MLGTLHVLAEGERLRARPDEQAVTKVRDLGLDSLWKYGAVAVFYAFAHSLLEEYYWRWFVFGQLKRTMRPSWAIGLIEPGVHGPSRRAAGNVLRLGLAARLCILVGRRHRRSLLGLAVFVFRSLFAPWLSHMLVDIAIFVIGYDLVRQLF